MFQVNEYKIVFKRVWHTDDEGEPLMNGRYDTKCEIYVQDKTMVRQDKPDGIVFCKEPRFTGIARLHPNDTPDKIVGKKIALRNALAGGEWAKVGISPALNSVEFRSKSVRTAIWKAFWKWVASWSLGHGYLYCERGCKTVVILDET